MKAPIRLVILTAAGALCLGASAGRLMSPKEKGEMVNAPMRRAPAVVRAPAIEQVILTWTYPQSLPRAGLVFDVEFRENLKAGAWAKVGETTAPPFAYATGSKRTGFFRIISRSTATNAVSVTLAWDASPDQNVVSYRLYRGAASGNYTSSIPVSGRLTTTASVSNIVARTFFAATAFNSLAQESVYSNEVDFTPAASTVYPVGNLTITKL